MCVQKNLCFIIARVKLNLVCCRKGYKSQLQQVRTDKQLFVSRDEELFKLGFGCGVRV